MGKTLTYYKNHQHERRSPKKKHSRGKQQHGKTPTRPQVHAAFPLKSTYLPFWDEPSLKIIM